MIKYRWVYCGYCESPIAFADTWDKLFCNQACLALFQENEAENP